MFVPFLYELRKRKVPVGATEAVNLARALEAGIHDSSLDGFYHVARAILIHSEAHLDAFDDAFATYFRGAEAKGLELRLELRQEILDWLKESVTLPNAGLVSRTSRSGPIDHRDRCSACPLWLSTAA